MQELASSLIFSPSDLNHFVECEHLTSLDLLAAVGQVIAKEQDPQAMRDRADVIYQGVFVNEPWRGIADFVVRVATPSALGPWSYESLDTKLTSSRSRSAILPRTTAPCGTASSAWWTKVGRHIRIQSRTAGCAGTRPSVSSAGDMTII